MRRLFYIIIMLVMVSCHQKTFDNRQEMMAFIKNSQNGLFQEKTINGIEISLMYRPTDLLVEQSLNGELNDELIDSLRKNFGGQMYFHLKYSKDGSELLEASENREEFLERFQNLSFRMDKMIHLTNSSKDTLPLLKAIYPRMYGMSNSSALLLVFSKDRQLKGDELTLNISEFGGNTGDIKFKIPIEKIIDEPMLDFN